jgi:hypothetical protein
MRKRAVRFCIEATRAESEKIAKAEGKKPRQKAESQERFLAFSL